MAKKKTYADALREDIRASIKSKNGDSTVGSILDSSANVPDWISTGDFMLDLALSNKIDGGIPVGRMIEIAGGEGAGKTLLASYIMANTQKRGGVAIYIDTEHAASVEVMQKSGVNIDDLIYVQAGSTEEVLQTMETIISKVHRENSDKLITIVWDSIAATSTKGEIEAEYMAGKTVALQARVIGLGMRKIMPLVSKHKVALVFINQLRENIGGFGFGDTKFTPGGNAIKYGATIRLWLSHYKKIMDKDKDLIGRIVKCDIKKNKVAPPSRSVMYTIRWGDEPGAWIDPAETMWDSGIRKNVLKKITQQKYSFKMSTGDVLEFTHKAFSKLIDEDENFTNEIKQALAKAYIITQKNISAKDITLEDAGEDG